jgi:hypothetical protein
MRCWRQPIFILLILSSVWLSGCRSSHANPAPARQSPAKSQAPTPPVAKHPPRDSALSLYHNPDYGVTFRYPRNYLLAEWFDSEDPSTRQSQQELAERQPGSIFIATVSIPSDAYPNTTFSSGSLQLVVNPMVTLETCQSFAAPEDEAYTSGSTSIQGITFYWRERAWAAAGTGSLDRDYAGFSNGTCYEFFLEIVTGSNPESDPRIKDADEVKIMRQLDKIVSSLQIHPPAPAAHTSKP